MESNKLMVQKTKIANLNFNFKNSAEGLDNYDTSVTQLRPTIHTAR